MLLRFYLAFAFLLADIGALAAQEKWNVSLLDRASVPPEIVEETRHAASGGLPDGLVDTHDGEGDIASASREKPRQVGVESLLGPH